MASSYSLGEHFERFIREQIEGGRYASASEVIRDALRLLEEDEDRRKRSIKDLRAEVDKGLRSGKPKRADDVLDRLERKYTKQTPKRRR